MEILIISSDYESLPHKTIVDNIVKHLPEYRFSIYRSINPNCNADVIYFLNIMDIIKNGYYPKNAGNIPSCTSIRSHRSFQEYPEKLKEILPHFKAISGDNWKMLSNVDFPNKFITPHAADESKFQETQPIDSNSKKLTVGYVGSFRDDKQYKIFQKATKKLGNKIVIKLAGKVSKKLAFDDMCEYYASVDCIVCCSKQEGGPTPPLEAALCGRSTITTDVGFMKEAFGNTATFFDGTEKDLIQKIEFLINHRHFLIELGQKAKKRIKNQWNWAILVKNYKDMFEDCHG